MKFNIVLCILLILAIGVFLLMVGAGKAHAAPLTYSGSLELRSPLWASRGHDVFVPDLTSPHPLVTGHFEEQGFSPRLRFLDLAGNIRITQKGSPLALWVSGEHSFSHGFFVHENKMKIGADWMIPHTPWTFFSFWDRRWDSDVDRVFVGVRVGFHGEMD